jgi:hypothetical protein
MTTTCLPPAAYYHINRNQTSMKPRIQEPQDPVIAGMLTRELGTVVSRSQEWESAFHLTFGDKAFEEAYPCIDWSSPRSEWAGDAAKFADAFAMADAFIASVMHRLFPFQYREMIPALTHALMAWSWRRETDLPRHLSEDDAILLLDYFGYDNMAEWLEEQR